MRVVLHGNRGRCLKKVLLQLMLAWGLSFCVLTSFSCNNILEAPLKQENPSTDNTADTKETPELVKQNKGGITISLIPPQTNQNNADSRTVQPDINPANLTDITLTGTKAGETTPYTLASWSSASQLSGQTVPLEEGVWNLVLTASNSSFIFSDTKNVTITMGQSQNVSFVLNTSETGGGIDFKISFSNNAQKLTYNLYRYSSGTYTLVDSNEDATINNEASGRSFTYQRTTSNPVNPGAYRLELKFYADVAKTVLLNTYSEIINVKAGFVSRSTNRTINLNQMYTITWHNDLTGCDILDALGNATTLPESYSLYTGAIQLPDLQKTGFIFEGWYTKDGGGNFSASPVTEISATETGNKEFWAKFIIELKEGPDFLATLTALDSSGNVERIVPSATAPGPSVTITQYLDTGTSVPVWYDSAENAIYYFADGHTNGTAKLYLRPNSSNIFMNLTSLKFLDITPFDTSRVTNMSQMFFGDSSLEKVYVSSAFTAVTSSTNAFAGCSTQLKGENGFAWSSSNAADATYARIDTGSTPGYFWSAPSSPLYFITYNCGTNPNGVNSSSNPGSYTTNQLPITLANPARSKTLANGQTGNYIFDGWYESADFSTPVLTSIPAGRSGNITLYAKWQVPYLVDHQYQNITDDNYTHNAYEIEHGYAGTGTSPTPWSGLALAEGFELKSGDPIPVTINDDGTTVVPIRYDRKLVTLTYNLNGGNVGGSTANLTRVGKYGASVAALATIEKTGRTLSGWQDSSGNTVTLPSTFPASNETYTAQWGTASYSITYNTNGGTIASSPAQPISYDVDSAEILLPGQTGAPAITRLGCTFAGWHELPDFSDSVQVSIPSGSTGNKTFYADWNVITYNIDYIVNGGSWASGYTAPGSYTVETSAADRTLPTATNITRAGYTFAGWHELPDCSDAAIASIPSDTIGIKTYYADWTANTTTPYTVKHYQQNIDDDEYTLFATDTTLSGTTDTSVTPTANSYTGFTAVTPISSITITGDGLAEGAVYYNRNTHSVSYANGVSGNTTITVPSGQTSVKYGASVTPVFTGMGTGTSGRTGYTFAGWKYGAATWTSGGGQAPLSMPDTDVTFTAQWTINSYTVTYLPGATGEVTVPAASTHEYNSTFDIDFAASRDYYDFAGWKRGATTYTSSGITTFTMPAEDVELTAQWTPISYNITYDFNGGTENASLNPATYTVQSDFDLAEPTRSDGDYKFDGWYIYPDGDTTKVTGFHSGNYHADITLKAKWLPLYAEVGSRKAYTKDEAINYIDTSSGLIYVTLTGAVTATDLGDYNTNDTICYTLAHKNATYDSIFLTVQSDANIQLTTCKQLFKNCAALKSADLRGLNVSNVTNMQSMFDSCTKLSSVDLSGWDTSKVQNMSYLFNSCENLQAPDLSSWNTSAVTEMDYMFNQCKKISVLDLSNFDTSSVTSMCYMFSNCEQLSELNLLSFDTSSVNYMYYMFASVGREVSSSYTSIYVSTDFVVKPGANTEAMFNYSKIEGGAGTKHEVTQGSDTNQGTYARIDGGDSAPGYFTELQYVAKVGNKYCTTLAAALTAIENSSGELNIVLGPLATQSNIGNYSTSGTIIYAIKNNCGASTVNLSVASGTTISFTGAYAVSAMFAECTKLKSADLRGFDISGVTGSNASMASMFNGCSNLESVNLSSLNTQYITTMAMMFNGCSQLTEVDLTSINFVRVTNMASMFNDCTSLEKITFHQYVNTGSLTNMNSAFKNCSALTELDLSAFYTDGLQQLKGMCSGCTALKYINLTSFHCENITSFEEMFYNCSNLELLDLREFSPSNITNLKSMFMNCSKLRKIFVNETFATKAVAASISTNMFTGCEMLSGGISTTFATDGVTDGSYAKIDGGTPSPGYFSGITNYARVGDAYYSNKEDTVTAILNSTGDIDVVLYSGVPVTDIWNLINTSGKIVTAIKSTAASVRFIVDRYANISLGSNNNNIGAMLSNCENLVYADLRGFDTSSAATITAVFSSSPNLKKVIISGWDISSVTAINDLFKNCSALEEVDITGWEYNVLSNCSYMFDGCTSLKVIYASYDFPSTVTYSGYLFRGCTALKGGAGTEFDASDTNYLSRARIDGGPDNPGYFTYRAP